MNNPTTQPSEQVQVLIVGGSVVGLSTALFLAWHGIPTLLVERHTDTSIHTRAGGFNARTMELYRQTGLEAAIFARETPSTEQGEMGARLESLTGKVLDSSEVAAHQRFSQLNPFPSPTRMAMLGQDQLEPVLRKHAAQMGSDIRFGSELVDFEQDTHGITAKIRELATGEERLVRAHYLVAADGNRSIIRQRLGIESHGYGTLGQWISILFRTDLSAALHGRKISLCFINNATVEGIMGQSKDRWALFANLKTEMGRRSQKITKERCLELVRAAIGIPDQPVEIISTLHWELASRVANSFQAGRIFLVGDAAHVMTTMGAFGANTGIADAHNLAWKLAYVLKGEAGPDLLTSYDQERQTAVELAVAVSTGLYAYRLPNHEQREAIMQSAQEMLDRVRKSQSNPDPTALAVINGYRYHSTAILSGDEDSGVLYENEPSGRPGTRAPHIDLMHEGQQISTLDLYGKHFVLLTGPEGKGWHKTFAEAARCLGITLDIYSIGPNEIYRDKGDFLASYGIGAIGAVLVRPDGFIAWRTRATDKIDGEAGQQILQRLLCR